VRTNRAHQLASQGKLGWAGSSPGWLALPGDPCAEVTAFYVSFREWVLASALIVLSSALASTVAAEVRIAGSADAIQVEVDNARLDEILAKLGVEYELRRTTETLEARINGTYRGSLRNVVSHLLDGYNYVIERRGSHGPLNVMVFGLKGTTPTLVRTPSRLDHPR
jgi:hypothetical protein